MIGQILLKLHFLICVRYRWCVRHIEFNYIHSVVSLLKHLYSMCFKCFCVILYLISNLLFIILIMFSFKTNKNQYNLSKLTIKNVLQAVKQYILLNCYTSSSSSQRDVSILRLSQVGNVMLGQIPQFQWYEYRL